MAFLPDHYHRSLIPPGLLAEKHLIAPLVNQFSVDVVR